MRICLLYNPKSGRGVGEGPAAEVARALGGAGHAVELVAAGHDLDRAGLVNAILRSELLVVAGGDGTVHHALPAIVETRAPFYHYPLGTENLLCRQFGSGRDTGLLLRAIGGGRHATFDAAECNGRMFAIMVSVGFDACVVERVAANRTAGVTRMDYVKHALDELLSHRPPELTVRVDGRPVVERTRGLAVVANSRHYAARINPAWNADMTDGLLDVTFFPHRSSAELAGWLAASVTGVHSLVPGLATGRGVRIEVEADEPWAHQIDGEAAGEMPDAGGGVRRLDVRVLPGALTVLVPP